MKILKRNKDADDKKLSQQVHYQFQKGTEKPYHYNCK